jgi:hypothetical protein
MAKRTTTKKTSTTRKTPARREVVMQSPLWYLAYGFVKAMAPDKSYQVIEAVYRFLLESGLPCVMETDFLNDLRHIHKAAAGACTCTPLPNIREPLVIDMSTYEHDRCRCPGCQERARQERARAN